MNSKRKNRQTSKTTSTKLRAVRRPLSLRKKAIFSIVATVIVLLVLEFALAAAGVRPVLVDEDPYVGFSSYIPLFIETPDAKTLTTNPNKLRWFNEQSFPKTKGPKTTRVFCMGGSTTYGRPYDDTTSFCGWLRAFLVKADASRNWEVINAGGISYASYRVATLTDELVKYDPDLFVIYTGHNEFLEERTYRTIKQTPSAIRKLGSALGHTRIYSAMHRAMKPAMKPAKKESAKNASELLPAEVKTRLDGGVGPDAYERDLDLQENVVQHYEYNLRRIIQKIRNAGVPVILIAPASNLASSSPFKSQHRSEIDPILLAEWQSHFEKAQAAQSQKQWSEAKSEIQLALKIDPDYAESHYLHGKILAQLGEHDEAKQAFLRARDKDVCPLRAISEIENAARKVANEEKVPFVDFIEMVAKSSSHGIAGDELFLDHVHPTIDGNRMLGLALVDELISLGVVHPDSNWDDSAISSVTSKVKQSLDRNAHAMALRNLAKVLSWAGKKEDADQLALRASEILDSDSETHYLAANALIKQGKFVEAVEKLQRALRVDPNNVPAINSLGAVLHQLGRLDEAIVQYQRVIELQPDFAPTYNNLGAVYQRQNKLAESAQQYAKAIELNPRYSKAFNNQGVVLRKQGQLDLAEKNLRQAIAINSQFAEAHYNLGLVLALRGNSESAIREFENALQADKSYAPAHHQIGIQYEERGDLQNAARHYREAMKYRSAPMDAVRRMAWILSTANDPALRNGKMAISLAQQCANATRYSDVNVLITLAAAHAELGGFQQAVEFEQKALTLIGEKSRESDSARLEKYRKNQPWRSTFQD